VGDRSPQLAGPLLSGGRRPANRLKPFATDDIQVNRIVADVIVSLLATGTAIHRMLRCQHRCESQHKLGERLDDIEDVAVLGK
jgi:hypothetical protein